MKDNSNLNALDNKDLDQVSGGTEIQTKNCCPKCGSVAYILILVEAGTVEHRKCTNCHTEYWYQRP